MTAAAQPGSDDELGPVDFLAIDFPGGRITAPGFEQLLSLADQGVVDILDMELITRTPTARARRLTSGSSPFPAVSTWVPGLGRRRACSMTPMLARSPRRCSRAVSPLW